jgi:hypothetical protein
MNKSRVEAVSATFEIRRKRKVLWSSRFLLEAFLSECDDNNLDPSLSNFRTWMDGDCESHASKAKTVLAIA